MKKVFLMFLASIIVLLGACGSNSKSGSEKSDTKKEASNGEKVTVTFWHAMTDAHEKWLKEKTEAYNKEHKDIEVKLVAQGNYGDLSQKLLAAAKAKKSPTIAQAYGEWMADYERNHLLADIKPMIDEKMTGADKYEDINQVFRDDNTINGKVYGIPFNKSTRVLFVNNDYLKKAGIKAPKTWDELKAAAKKLTTEIDGKKVTGMGFENQLAHELSMYVKQAGGQFVDEKSAKVKFNSEEGLKALEFINGMIQDKTARMAGEDEYLSGPFTNGDVAMYIGSSAGIPFIQKDAKDMNWTTVPLPQDKVKAAPFQGTNITMFSQASKEEQAAAFDYMKYLISTDNTIDWAKTTGYLPVRKSALENADWKKFVKENPVNQAGIEQYDGAFIDDRVPGAFAMKEAMASELDKMLFEKQAPKTTLENMAKKAQEAIDKAKK